MRFAQVRTRRIRVEPLDPVRQPVLNKEIQGPVGHRRLGSKSFLGQELQNFISAQRPVFFQQKLQHPPSYGSEAQPFRAAILFRILHRFGDAMSVIVISEAYVFQFSRGPQVFRY